MRFSDVAGHSPQKRNVYSSNTDPLSYNSGHVLGGSSRADKKSISLLKSMGKGPLCLTA